MKKAVSAFVGLPLDFDQQLIRTTSCEAVSQAVHVTLVLPLRVRPRLEEMQAALDRDRERGSRSSPLAPVVDLLGGWSVPVYADLGGPLEDEKKNRVKKMPTAKTKGKPSPEGSGSPAARRGSRREGTTREPIRR